MPAAADEAEAVLAAVAALLELDGARVTMGVDRWKGEDGPEHLIVGDGGVEPAAARGRMRYDLSGLVAIPGGSPSPLDRIDVAWDDETLWGRPADGDAWEANERQAARETGGLIGRLPDEVVGLVEVVAASGAGSVTTLPPEAGAARYLVAVPIDAAADLGVPADTPNADVIREANGIDEIPVEVWLRDGEVVRLRYSFEREKALYGGPDRTQVTYDWTADPAVRIELPPGD